MAPRGKFIVLEGGEGAGKSTQIRALVEFLRGKGIDVVQTREVGGCPQAEALRDFWLTKGAGYWDRLSELMLVMTARREHIVRTILPALERGAWVVSDRFADSTRVYQGAQGVPSENIEAAYNLIAEGLSPDLTLLLDLPVEQGLKRMHARKGMDDRFQNDEIAVHNQRRDIYLGLVKADPQGHRIVDASPDPETVAKSVAATVAEVFGL